MTYQESLRRLAELIDRAKDCNSKPVIVVEVRHGVLVPVGVLRSQEPPIPVVRQVR